MEHPARPLEAAAVGLRLCKVLPFGTPVKAKTLCQKGALPSLRLFSRAALLLTWI